MSAHRMLPTLQPSTVEAFRSSFEHRHHGISQALSVIENELSRIEGRIVGAEKLGEAVRYDSLPVRRRPFVNYD
jgi:hypothetical protein